MSRKVFISFLGFSNYIPVSYIIEDYDQTYISGKIKFVQEATLTHLKDKFEQPSIAYFLVTEGAMKNWNDQEEFNLKTGEREYHEGLHTRLLKLNLPFSIEKVDIPNGKTQDEIWDIFGKIYNLLEEKDVLYFDVTHSFRTLPMLNMVLINYGKLLKNITVGGIYYGAFDAKFEREGETVAPIWNMTTFSELQDWTIAVNGFINFGSSTMISQLIKTKIAPTLQQKDLNDNITQARTINLFNNSLSMVTEALQTNRGKLIVEGKMISTLIKNLESVESTLLIPAIKPLLKKVQDKIEQFEPKESWKNGFIAVKWCIDHGLIQQGYTMLLECIITYLCKQFDLDYTNESQRDKIVKASMFIISKKIQKKEDGWVGISSENAEKIKEILPHLSQEFCSRFESLSTKRNDINHAGFVNTESPQNLVHKLKDDFAFFYEYIIKQHNETS